MGLDDISRVMLQLYTLGTWGLPRELFVNDLCINFLPDTTKVMKPTFMKRRIVLALRSGIDATRSVGKGWSWNK